MVGARLPEAAAGRTIGAGMADSPPSGSSALPPGQRRVSSLPVLHVGEVPTFDPASWSLRVAGAVDHPLRLAWRDLAGLPRVEVVCDLHGGTGWTCCDLRFGGVSLQALVEACAPRPEARFLVARDGETYSAGVPLDFALEANALLALELDGAPLALEHGGPLRLLVPGRYAWKSVKWVRVLDLVEADEPGYWERRGAHPGGDPWREERLV